jgi:hypothetical protein
MAAIALVASKIWYTINRGYFNSRPGQDNSAARYFLLNYGPGMSYADMLLQGAIALGALGVLYLLWRSARADDGESPPIDAPVVWTIAPLVQQVAVVALGLMASALVVEGVVRLTWRRAFSEAAADPLTRYHARLGWESRPGARAEIDGAEIAINEQGQRGPLVPFERARVEQRVLLLGDGFIEGDGVPEASTLRAALESLLVEPRAVLNAGVAGYSTDQELLAYRESGRRYRPDRVVLGFSADDVYGNTVPRVGLDRKPSFELVEDVLQPKPLAPEPVPVFPHRAFPRPHGWLPWHGSLGLRLLSNYTLDHAPALHAHLAAFGVVQETDVPAELRAYGRRQELGGAWELTRALLRQLKDDVEADGGQLIVLYVPAAFELDEEAWSTFESRYGMTGRQWTRTLVAERLQAACASDGIAMVDPRPALGQTIAAGVPAYGAHGFWTAAGHRAAAQAVAEALQGHVRPTAP